jgi:hypothetical protein
MLVGESFFAGVQELTPAKRVPPVTMTLASLHDTGEAPKASDNPAPHRCQ